MERPAKYFNFVNDLGRLITDRMMDHKVFHEKVAELFQENFENLRSMPGYIDHMKSIDNDFAYLSLDIIHDVLEMSLKKSAIEQNQGQLALVEGHWGLAMRKFSEIYELTDAKIVRVRHSLPSVSTTWLASQLWTPSKREEISEEEAKNHLIRKVVLWPKDDIEKCNQLLNSQSLTFCGHLCMHYVSIPDSILRNLGTRFSHVIHLAHRNYVWSEHELVFINRQLRSSYLQSCFLDGQFSATAISESVMCFVTSRNFCAFSISSPIPYAVFERFYDNWKAQTLWSRCQSIAILVTDDAIGKLSDKIGVAPDSWKPKECKDVKHPVNEEWTMKISYDPSLRSISVYTGF
ncbi:hypothetical protein QR680_009959 [Steinernema hermaphroditum]|uniref:Uncharacterized protein n=1 Tax=Steinernema hermaphroditum TaxID=289476 RepID=A0AA39MAC8_9BILA|nr:hypothetical protein QR680_009959 [Steinernema hermaphroditum]